MAKLERELEENRTERIRVEDALLKAEETYKLNVAELNSTIEKRTAEAKESAQSLQAMVTCLRIYTYTYMCVCACCIVPISRFCSILLERNHIVSGLLIMMPSRLPMLDRWKKNSDNYEKRRHGKTFS